MGKYMDGSGLSHFMGILKGTFAAKSDAVKSITRSGTTFTATRADGTTFTFTQQDNTVAKTSTTPKMNGTAAIGTETAYAAGDHVHPTDTSRAPVSHASTATTYGAGNASNYGHVKLSDATDGTAAAASGGTAATPKAVSDALTSAKAYADGAADMFAEKSMINEVYSRGEQLIVNGNGFMGDNTNFSNWTFDGSVANNSKGSFTRTPAYTVIVVDDFIPVDPSKSYAIEFDIKCGTDASLPAGAKIYAFLNYYDVDGLQVGYYHGIYHRANTTTTLAQDLKNGDTVVHFTDLTKWWVGTIADHQRSFIFWDYTNSLGYTYPPNTYSRHEAHAVYASNDSVNKTNNTIALSSAWNGGTVPAGTKVSQNASGGNFDYTWYHTTQSTFPTEWKHVKSIRHPSEMWKGVATVKVGFLWNYGYTASAKQQQIWVTNLSMRAIDAECESLGFGKLISYGSDLNSIVEVGEYHIDTNANVASITNKPSGLANAFTLIVSYPLSYRNTTYIAQELTEFQYGRKWRRLSLNSGTSWGAWVNGDGLGAAAYADTVPIANGGTGKTTAAEAWTALGGGAIGKKASLAESDIPSLAISKVTNLQTSLDGKAPLASPDFTGTPTAPTAATGTNTTQVATTAFVKDAIDNLTVYSEDIEYGTGTVAEALDEMSQTVHNLPAKAFTKVKVGTTTVEADSSADTLTLAAGTNVTLTPDTANDSITISVANTTGYSLDDDIAGRANDYGPLYFSEDAGDTVMVDGPLPVEYGGTGVATIAALKTALGLEDSGWKTLPLNGNAFKVYSNDASYTPMYRKVNGVVEVTGGVSPNTTQTLGETALTIGTLPAGFRPASNRDVQVICQASDRKLWLLRINSSGTVYAQRMRDMGSTSYQSMATTEWMLFTATFLAG